MLTLNSRELDSLIALALSEDVGAGDITTLATLEPDTSGSAVFQVKATGCLAGLPAIAAVYRQLDPAVQVELLAREGDRVEPGQFIARARGPAAAILTGERISLNLLQFLSGVATRTARFVDLVAGTDARIVDTRKTLPGYRSLCKYAVRVGGGHNHRFGLYDGVLIKDNHIQAAGGIGAAISRARRTAHHLLKIEIEVETLDQLREALDAGADVLMLDNMDLDTLRQAVELCRGRAITEASGGVNESTVRGIAEAGVDLISVGALTHSVTALDISLDWE